MPSTKRCPFCAEEVLSAAIKCKHCGSQIPAPPPPKSLTKLIGALCLAIIGGVFLLGMLRGCQSHEAESSIAEAVPSSPSPAIPEPPPLPPRSIYRITAPDLWAAYTENEIATDLKIGKSIVEISGTIAAIDKDFLQHPVLNLATASPYESVRLRLAETDMARAAELSRGENIVIRCDRVDRVLGSPYGSDCFIVH